MVSESPVATGALVALGMCALVALSYRLLQNPQERSKYIAPLATTVGWTALALLWFLDAIERTPSWVAPVLLVAAGGSFILGSWLLLRRDSSQ